MSDLAISTVGISKRYRLGQYSGYGSLRESLSTTFSRFFRQSTTLEKNELWALRDVSFELRKGEVLGIIGRNGAGKSTLLKVLSRITEPTSGRVEIHGRVGSLLEVGTGFHPELSGRENIFLNGAILGMSRREIRAHFDEIVDFAEVDQFVDTPVKRFSSGMRLRLAFAVAAFLEPEILMIDEVLAVGDAAFQQKCLRKMNNVASRGRTVLFVSHNLGAINSLCSRAIMLREGALVEDGDPSTIIEKYLFAHRETQGKVELPEPEGAWIGRISAVEVLDRNGRPTTSVGVGEGCSIQLECQVSQPVSCPGAGVVIQDCYGHNLIRLTMRETFGSAPKMTTGGKITLTIPSMPLLPGSYSLQVGLANSGQLLDLHEDAVRVDVHEMDVYPTAKLPATGKSLIFTPCEWDLDYQ